MASGVDYRIIVWDRNGWPLGELETDILLTYARDEIGTAEFELSARYDPKATPDMLLFGNFVTFEHPRLPAWVGVIAPNDNKEWTGDGSVVVRCKSALFQFTRRRTVPNNAVNGTFDILGTAGDVIAQVLANANYNEDTRIRVGTIFSGGTVYSAKIRNRMLIEGAQYIISLGYTFSFDVARDEHGRLKILMNLTPARNVNNGYVLQEDINIETPSGSFFMEGGEMVNDAHARNNTSEDTPWMDADAVNYASKNTYGLWQGNEIQDVGDQGKMQELADERIRLQAYPRKSFTLTAIESTESPDTFANLRIGDAVRVVLHSPYVYFNQRGVDEMVAIDAMEYSTAERKLGLATTWVPA